MKPDSEEFKSLFESIFTPELNQLVDLFKKYNHEIRLAGGPVRYIFINLVALF
jgi:tRNA nucleotidyltransferase (CCA-adding enzyme)